jgi:membrane protein implicated in regulation of membrane protease activity
MLASGPQGVSAPPHRLHLKGAGTLRTGNDMEASRVTWKIAIALLAVLLVAAAALAARYRRRTRARVRNMRGSALW